jgi:transcriptional regulator with XRE-family HTH domain
VALSGKISELMTKILSANSVTKMLIETKNQPALPPVGDYLDGIRREKGLKKEEFFILGGVSSAYGYEILRGKKAPSRDTLIQFAFALKMNVDQTQELLMIGEKAQLSPMQKRDALIIYAITHEISMIDLNIKAEENKIPPIGNFS